MCVYVKALFFVFLHFTHHFSMLCCVTRTLSFRWWLGWRISDGLACMSRALVLSCWLGLLPLHVLFFQKDSLDFFTRNLIGKIKKAAAAYLIKPRPSTASTLFYWTNQVQSQPRVKGRRNMKTCTYVQAQEELLQPFLLTIDCVESKI